MAGQQMPVAQMGAPYASFSGKLQQPLLKALQVKGYTNASPVQEKVLTELPNFRSDCLVQAKTGTGKTVAFLLPTLNSLLTDSGFAPAGNVSVLIVSPTRELALQIKAECDMLTSQITPRIECHTAFGGTKKETHLNQFLNGKPTVLVATPGRLNDYLDDEHVASKFSNLRTLILDEADTMLEAGFLPAINQILQRLPPKHKGWQGMCFSATMPEKIKNVLGRVLKPGYTHITTVDPNDVPTIDAVAQFSVIISDVSATFSSLLALLEQERQAAGSEFKAIVFGTTANGVALMHDLFQQVYNGVGISVYELHSRLTQTARTRTTDEFKKVPSGIMFASDVIGRGMDFPAVSHVFQVGLPTNAEQYVHRVGRTARAGAEGRAIILLTEQEKYFVSINKHLPIKPYPTDISSTYGTYGPNIDQALANVDQSAKDKAYQAYLGFHKTFMKNLRLDVSGLVGLANSYARSMGCPEPPMIDKMVVGKMGLKGAQGLNVGVRERGPKPGRGGGGGGPGGTGKGPTANGGVQKNSQSAQNGGRGGRGGGGGRRGRGGRGGGAPV